MLNLVYTKREGVQDMIKGKLERDERIFLIPSGENRFRVDGKNSNKLFGESDDFYIYMRSVNFRSDGKIDGVYLGENPQTIIDKHCQNATFTEKEGWMLPDRVRLKTARLVAVQNKTGVVVIIQSR